MKRLLPWSIPRRSRTDRIGQRLDVTQHGHELLVRVCLRPDVDLVGLWALRTDDGTWIPLPTPTRRGDGFEARLDLLDLLHLPGNDQVVGSKILLYLEIEHDLPPGQKLAEKLAERPGTHLTALAGGGQHARYRCELGRFAQTSIGRLSAVREDALSAIAYPTREGFVGVAVNHDPESHGGVVVTRLAVVRGVLRMRGLLRTGHGDLESAELVLKGRTTGHRITRPLEVERDDERTRQRFGLRQHRYTLTLDWGDLLEEGELRDDVYDAWMSSSTSQSAEPHTVRVGKTRFLVRYFSLPGWARRGDRAATITPYYTYKAHKTSFQVDLFDADALLYMRSQLRRRVLLRARRRLPALVGRAPRPVWLVGERPYKAQDTGFHFFRYLRENHPEIDAYYVIDPASPEYANVEPLGNVLHVRSREHIHKALIADRFVGSHHADYLYPTRTRAFRRAVRKVPKVFMQHGVMGTKYMANFYGKSAPGFETDTFLVSSEREKRMIVEDFGFDPEEVAVTGLSRFDSLLAADVPVRRQIIVIPTWRDWLTDPDTYVASEYHARWSQLLHHPRLRELTETRDLDVVFCLHPNMQQFTPLFAGAPARVVSQGEIDVQRLLKTSAMMVTDYSSVGFDFGFLHRPVIYYQFDRQRFLGVRGSHLDLDNELPGSVRGSVDTLLDEIDRATAGEFTDNGFTMAPEHVARADRFLTHRDRTNCDRIFQACVTARHRRSLRHALATHEISAATFRVFRRSKAYYPLMRTMFHVLRRLPADDRLVVFESGMGRQYSDSPRYLYEELVRRGGDLRKVWVYQGKIHGADELTRNVKRLSPGYFWALGRARYWVNNQSFPHYLRRRPDGVYVQTWHGTPLKRMLHDLDTIKGRDEGYVQRATRAASQWSVLVSPSPFVTDVMRSAFRYTGRVIEQGYPRNDLLLRPDRDEIAARVRRNLGIDENATVVLYAPTFRDNQTSAAGRFTFELPLDLERFRETLGENVVLLLRMHVLVRGRIRIPEGCEASVRNVSAYPEIQELYLASDALVTDYSSVFFDFAALRRPMVFYAYDLESYRDNLRGFYLDFEQEVPGPVVTTECALHKALMSLDTLDEEYSDRYDAFLARFCPRDDGHAAQRVVDEVFGTVGGNT